MSLPSWFSLSLCSSPISALSSFFRGVRLLLMLMKGSEEFLELNARQEQLYAFVAYMFVTLFSWCSYNLSVYMRITLVCQMFLEDFFSRKLGFLVRSRFFLAGWSVLSLLDIMIWRFCDLVACRKVKVIHRIERLNENESPLFSICLGRSMSCCERLVIFSSYIMRWKNIQNCLPCLIFKLITFISHNHFYGNFIFLYISNVCKEMYINCFILMITLNFLTYPSWFDHSAHYIW